MNYASDFRRMAREALQGNWRTAVLTGFVGSLMGASLWSSGGSSGSSNSSGSSAGEDLFYQMDGETLQLLAAILMVLAVVLILWGIVVFVISGAAKFGYAIFNLNLVDGKEARFSDLFSQFGRIGSGIIMNLLVGLYTFLWSLLFIIPGIIKSYSYSMTPFILAEHPEISENEAITRSRHLMDGNKWRLFCLMFSFIGWELLISAPFLVCFIVLISLLTMGSSIAFASLCCLLSFVLLFVGQLFLVPYQQASLAAFYRDISGEPVQDNRTLPGEVI